VALSIAPRITVIIPCFNQARFLDEALASVSQQSFPDWECIIVDDGSPDHAEGVVEPWLASDARFRYLRQANRGLSSARNLGLRHAKGAFIQFLDADDLIEPDKFTHHMHHIDDGIDVSIAGCRYFHDAEGPTHTRILFHGANPETIIRRGDSVDVPEVFQRSNPFTICAPLYRKRLLERVGGFDESLHALEDWHLNLRCALQGAVFHHCGYADRSLSLVRLHPASVSNNARRMRVNDLRFRAACAMDPSYRERFGAPTRVPLLNARSGALAFLYAKQLALWLLPPVIMDGLRALWMGARSRA
jgi:glycosyltransferase involved in cell wall biosynthesis